MLSRAVLRTARTAAPSRFVAARTYAAAAATENVKPPITLFGLDGTYATALYTAAIKTSSLEPTSNALNKLGALVAQDPKLDQILSSPTLSVADKSAVIKELQKQAGPAGSQATVINFLETLAENNRLGLLRGVCDKFSELIAASRGEIELVVTSAQPLDSKTLGRLEAAVAKSQYVEKGQKLKVTNTVNPEIVGGLVVEVGDRTIDLSVSARVAKLNKLLTDSL